MTEKINTLLRDSKAARWTALVLLASAMFFAYMFVDILSPLQALLQETRGWGPDDYGTYAGSETFLNVFVFFLIFAGIILDKIGVRNTALLSSTLMVIGTIVKYWAVSDAFIGSATDEFLKDFWTFFPFSETTSSSAKMASFAFMIFGCGVEMAGITVSKGIVKWFKGKEMALAMGLEMAIARIGVAAAMLLSPLFAGPNKLFSTADVSRPVLLCVILMLVGFISFTIYFFMDKKLEKQMGESGEEPEEPFKISDLGKIFSSKVFWVVSLLCVLYYSAIFPFQKYAVNMLQCNLGYTADTCGMIFAVFPLGAAAITPFLGSFLDHKGKGATMLIFGALLMIICHSTFALILPATKGTMIAPVIAFLAIILLGISFSLVPAALWPSVPKLIDNKLLGSAYAVIFWIQNIGLFAFPMIIGKVLKACNIGIEDPVQYNYTIPMLIFASLGIIALLLGLYLKAIDKKNGYGLEEPNIK
ncbi:MAG: MFS transporter [Bacteroidales bacterium]|nr:MFS transporter [Bacteroidales bacterium]MDY5193795.1 MFS transporter [Candidatus Aphodosoma sp.]